MILSFFEINYYYNYVLKDLKGTIKIKNEPENDQNTG